MVNKISNQVNLTFHDRASSFGDNKTLDNILTDVPNSHVQQSGGEGVKAAIRHEDMAGQKGTHGLIANQQTSGTTSRTAPTAISTQNAQNVLENQADRLAVNARQFQSFLTGGAKPGLQRWGNGQSSNFANQLFNAGVSYMIRG
jgi:hypothetical protein